jgi:hypothetical protein
MLALTLPISGGRSVGIVRLRTEATEISSFFTHTGGRNFVELFLNNYIAMGRITLVYTHLSPSLSFNNSDPNLTRLLIIHSNMTNAILAPFQSAVLTRLLQMQFNQFS